MDSNDPNNPNSSTPGATPPMTPDPNASAPSPWGPPVATPTQGAPLDSTSSQTASDLPPVSPTTAVPGEPSIATTPPEPAPIDSPAAPAAPNSWEQSPSSQPVASPWESSSSTPSSVGAPTPLSDPMAPAQPTAEMPQSQWTSAVPAAPAEAPASSQSANPFLQPQTGANFSMPGGQTDPSQAAQPLQPQTPLPPPGSPELVPNPGVASSQDPMNTAFSPGASPTPNPFASQPPTDPQSLGGAPAAAPATQLGSPWGPPAEQTPPATAEPIQGFVNTSEPPTTPEQPGQSAGEGAVQDQTVQENPQAGTLDLSSLQNTQTPPNMSAQGVPATPAPGPAAPAPTENAPTDLSHLIAGDESQPSQPMGNVYTPPVASDQPQGNVPQTPATSTEGGSAAPPEKHLNLTKVLLVAGIPIILIVAALSAYLILGVGRAAPEEDTTSLPVEQTAPVQAPLTNPPQQIVAPSPRTIPDPATSLPTPPPTASPATTLPTPPSPSPASAMDRLRAGQQSPSPAASPESTPSTSLPVN